MPTFDFQCSACGHVFEFKRSFTSNKVPRCPACKSADTEKLIAPPTIHFHGSGFFVTDNGAAKKAAVQKPEQEQKKEAKAPEKPSITTEKKKE